MDFRGPAEQPGSKGQYAGVQIHAGLICINGPARMSGKIQTELFAAVLDMIQETTPAKGDMVNEVIEVYLAEEGWGIRDRSLSVAQLGRVILIRQFTQMIRSLYALAL